MKKLTLERLTTGKNKFLLLLCCLSQATLQASSASGSSRSSDLEIQLEEAMASPTAKGMDAALVVVVGRDSSPEVFYDAHEYLSKCQKEATRMRRKSIDTDDEKLIKKANRRFKAATKAQNCLTSLFNEQQQILLDEISKNMIGRSREYNHGFSSTEIAVMDRVLQGLRAGGFKIGTHIPTISLSPDAANLLLKGAMEAPRKVGHKLLHNMLKGAAKDDPFAMPIIITEEMLEYAKNLHEKFLSKRQLPIGLDDEFEWEKDYEHMTPSYYIFAELRDLFLRQQFAKACEIIKILKKESKDSANLMECAYVLQKLRSVFLQSRPGYYCTDFGDVGSITE